MNTITDNQKVLLLRAKNVYEHRKNKHKLMDMPIMVALENQRERISARGLVNAGLATIKKNPADGRSDLLVKPTALRGL